MHIRHCNFDFFFFFVYFRQNWPQLKKNGTWLLPNPDNLTTKFRRYVFTTGKLECSVSAEILTHDSKKHDSFIFSISWILFQVKSTTCTSIKSLLKILCQDHIWDCPKYSYRLHLGSLKDGCLKLCHQMLKLSGMII